MKKLFIALMILVNFISADAAKAQPDEIVGSYKVGSKKYKVKKMNAKAEVSGSGYDFLLNLSLASENGPETGVQFMIFDPELGVDYELYSFAEENFQVIFNGNVAGLNFQEYEKKKDLEISKNLDELAPVYGYVRLESIDENGVLHGIFDFDSKMEVVKFSNEQSDEEPEFKDFYVEHGEFSVALSNEDFKKINAKYAESGKLKAALDEDDLGETKIAILDITTN